MLFEKIKLEEEEKVLKVVRRHWFIITVELFGILVVAMLPFFVLVGYILLPESMKLVAVPFDTYMPHIILGISLWLVLTLMSGFMIWTHYFLDLWVITDHRIIAIEQIHFFNRNVSIFRLERLQDIEYTINGILATLLNFGVISAQTAGHTEHNFRSPGMPDPRGLQAAIQQAMDSRLRALHITADEVGE